MRYLAYSWVFLLFFVSFPLAEAAEPKLIQNIKKYNVPSQFKHNPGVQVLHNALHYSGDSFTVGDDVYHVVHYYRSTKLAIDGTDVGMILELGRCRSQGFRIYCFEDLENTTQVTSATRSWQGRTLTYNVTKSNVRVGGGELLDRVRLSVYSIGPDVRVNRIITPPPHTAVVLSSSGGATRISNYVLDQPITIQAVFRNVGNYPAENFVYKDPYPPEILVSSSTGPIENNTALLRGTLIAGEEKRLTYSILPKKEITHSHTATYSYEFEGIRQNKTTDTLTLELNQSPYTLTYLPPLSALTDTPLSLVITVDNKAAEKIDVQSFDLVLPPGVDLITIPIGYSWNPPTLSWSGSIPYQDKKTVALPVRTSQKGTYPFRVALKLTVWKNGVSQPYEENQNYSFTVQSNRQLLDTKLRVTPETTPAGSPVHVFLRFYNKDSHSYRSLSGTLTSNAFLQNATIYLDRILPEENKTLFDQNFRTWNYTNKTQTYTLLLNLSYRDETNNPLLQQTKAYLTLQPPTHLVTLRRNAPGTVDPGQEFTVTTDLVKDVDQDLQLEIHDEFTPGIQLAEGIPFRAFDLTKKEKTLSVYAYRLRVPLDYPSNTLGITTYVRAVNKNILQTDTHFVSVRQLLLNQTNTSTLSPTPPNVSSPKPPNETQNTTPNLTEAVQAQTLPPPPKKSFFQGFLDFFKGLF